MMSRALRVAPLLALLAGSIGVAGQGTPAQPAPPPQAPTPPASPQPPVTFRAEVNYVEVDARVIDAQGNFVPGLTQQDFQVFEGGKPQQVSTFAFVNIPVERPERPLFASKPIVPDVQTNVGFDGRVYLIVLDDLHTNALRSQRVKATARQFVERYVGVNDLAAVVHTSGRGDAGQEFTANPQLLLAAIDKFMGRKVRSATLERNDEEQRTRGTRDTTDTIADPSDFERGYQARNTLETLKSLSEYLGNVRGRRKALVFFSEGIDYDITDPLADMGNGRGNNSATTIIDATRDVIAAATRSNVAIYGIDPRGLTSGADDSIEVSSFPDDNTLGIGTSSLVNEVRLGQDSLRTLADETGGFAVVNRNDFRDSFQRLVADNSSYYVLGYYPVNDKRDGRYRKIEVKVNRPNITVRARKGYVAPRGKAPESKAAANGSSAELRDAMASPLPTSALPLAASAAVFKGPSPNGSVVVSALLGARDLALTEKDGTFHNDLEIAVLAVDQKGKSYPGDRNTITLALKPDSVPRMRAAGFRILTGIDLPPGRYQLRVAVREALGKRAGSVFSDVEVPDFTKEKLVMSNIALTSATSGIAPTVRPKDPLKDLLPGPMTTYRDFAPQDEIALFTEVYDNTGAIAHKVAISATLRAEGGQTVYQTREERESSELAGQGGGYGFTTRIPLKSAPPGLYVLRVEAQALAGDRPTVAREVMLRIITPPERQGANR